MALTEPDDTYANPNHNEGLAPASDQEIGSLGNILDPGFNLTLRPMPVSYTHLKLQTKA